MTTGEGVEGLDTVSVLVVDMALSFLSVGDRFLCLLLAPLYLDFLKEVLISAGEWKQTSSAYGTPNAD
jgi:hypothetical protein